MNLSLAITTYNRYTLTIESFAQVIDDDRIDDIVILDDCSTDGSFEKLVKYFKGNDKVRVIRQARNRGMSLNKRDAIALSKNKWVIIFDSDNIIRPDYVDAFLRIEKRHPYFIYCPSFARPQFNYNAFAGKTFGGAEKIPIYDDVFNCLMNTCNYIVNASEYVKVYDYNEEMKATDTVWFNYRWLKSKRSFYVVPGMEYEHRVHDGSGFLADVDYNMKKSEEIRKLIAAL